MEHLRQIAAELQMADVREQVILSLSEDFVDYSEFKPRDGMDERLSSMVNQVIRWSTAMRAVRQ